MSNKRKRIKNEPDESVHPENVEIESTPKKRIKRELDESSHPKTVKSEPKEKKPIKTERVKSSKTKDIENEASSSKSSSTQASGPIWDDFELLAEQENISLNCAQNIIKLFEDKNTIPFIARYRRHLIEDTSPEKLRNIKESYEEICSLKNKISSVVNTLQKSNVLTEPLKRAIRCSRSAEELDYIYAPYKPESKRTLAQKAKDLGLEVAALDFINNPQKADFAKYVNPKNKELDSLEKVRKGVMNIIASIVATDTELLVFLRNLRGQMNFLIKSKKSKSKQSDEKNEIKFDNYYDFEIPIKYIKHHQVLALNRGESLKILSVSITVPDKFFNEFKNYCWKKWISKQKYTYEEEQFWNSIIQESYTRFVQPHIIREIRSELKMKAEKASCEVFSKNLKQLLLAPPIKGKIILGIDPGFSNGCKVAVISSTGSLLDHSVIYPFNKNNTAATNILEKLLSKYNCNLIALGNGKACRETEEWLTQLIQSKTFNQMNVQYTIVNEDGASVYSCSPEAKKEFPELDPNIISAVSLARRIQDPLSELIKIEPKHLGIGMYQHDIKKKQLSESLDDVVSECVSFVGVDLNTASECLLKHVAGLTAKKAALILSYKEKNGPFHSRKQLMKITGIGEKIFQQCAGFLRVGPTDTEEKSNFYKKTGTTKLDCTYIHPETYEYSMKLLKKLNLNINDLGSDKFINEVKGKRATLNLETLSKEYGCSVSVLNFILDTFSKPLNYDLRDDFNTTPLFKKGIKNIDDLRIGESITGSIKNVTDFGSFVDIGVGINGLIHISKSKGMSLQIGNRVEVKILNIDKPKKRIGLELIKIL